MLVRSLVCLLPLLSTGAAQDLLYSLAADLPGAAAPWARAEIQRVLPNGGSTPFVPIEALAVLFGDRDGNGIYDDAPTNIDALHVRTAGGATTWLLSTSVTTALAGPGSLRDGDIFHFDGQGGIVIAYPEDAFAMATQTSGIDVDAFAEGTVGEVYFSFAEDETTQSPTLIAQNGGNAALDEQTVFRLDPGASEAVIHFTKDQTVALFNTALGTGATSIVDVTGLAIDPLSPADLLLTSGSSNGNFRGVVVSSAGGGVPFTVGGSPVDPGLLGVGATASLDALSTTREMPHPVLRTLPPSGSSAAGGVGRVEITGVQPGAGVQIGVAEPTLPSPFAWTAAGATGFAVICPNPQDPIFLASLDVPAWRLMANANGVAEWSFDYLGLTPGTAAVVQATVVGTGLVTSPGVVTVLP